MVASEQIMQAMKKNGDGALMSQKGRVQVDDA